MTRTRSTCVTALAVGLLAAVAACTGPSATATGTPAQARPGGAPSTGPSARGSDAAVPTPAVRMTESNPPGDIPDNQAYVTYRPAGASVSVKVPEGWARSVSGSVTTFTDKLNRIEIATSQAAKAPTAATVTASDVPQLKQGAASFTLGKVITVDRPAGRAILMTYQVDSPPDPVTGKVVRDAVERYTFSHNGSRVDLSLIGPTNADNVDPWRVVTNSVAWQ